MTWHFFFFDPGAVTRRKMMTSFFFLYYDFPHKAGGNSKISRSQLIIFQSRKPLLFSTFPSLFLLLSPSISLSSSLSFPQQCCANSLSTSSAMSSNSSTPPPFSPSLIPIIITSGKPSSPPQEPSLSAQKREKKGEKESLGK